MRVHKTTMRYRKMEMEKMRVTTTLPTRDLVIKGKEVLVAIHAT
jgi:hypothetical protein